jgi:hypothetical protein
MDIPISDKLPTAELPCGGSNKIHISIQGVYRAFMPMENPILHFPIHWLM